MFWFGKVTLVMCQSVDDRFRYWAQHSQDNQNTGFYLKHDLYEFIVGIHWTPAIWMFPFKVEYRSKFWSQPRWEHPSPLSAGPQGTNTGRNEEGELCRNLGLGNQHASEFWGCLICLN